MDCLNPPSTSGFKTSKSVWRDDELTWDKVLDLVGLWPIVVA